MNDRPWRKWIFAGALFGLLLTSQAPAYTLTTDFGQGFYWAALPVSVKAETPELRTLLEECINEWEREVGMDIWQYQDNAPNIVRWTNDITRDTGYDANTTLAVTTRYHQGTYIGRMDIVLNGAQEVLRQNQYQTLRETILHELGHTVGLGHSDDASAVMSAYLNYSYYLGQDDINGMAEVLRVTQNRQAQHYVSPLAMNSSGKGRSLWDCAGQQDSDAMGVNLINLLWSLFAGLICSAIVSLVSKLPRKRH
jgi:hypothetical protein